MSDEEPLLEALAAAMRHTDAVPTHVTELAKAVPEIASLDVELAELTELAATRSDLEPGDLIFETDGLTVIVGVNDGDGRVLDIIGVDDSSEVVLITGDGERHPPGIDGSQYRIPEGVRGPMRVVIDRPDGGPVATDWFT